MVAHGGPSGLRFYRLPEVSEVEVLLADHLNRSALRVITNGLPMKPPKKGGIF